MPKLRRAAPDVFKQQADATLSQSNPTSGQKYTVLDTVKNARIISIAVSVTWTVQPSPLEIHITIDGQTIVHTQTNPVSNTDYYPIPNPQNQPSGQLMSTGGTQFYPFIYEGRSVKIEAETTGGTVSDLSARVKYAKK